MLKQIAKILECKNTNDVISLLVSEFNKIICEYIKNYSKFKYNIQDHDVFISESDFYELVIRSKKEAINLKHGW